MDHIDRETILKKNLFFKRKKKTHGKLLELRLLLYATFSSTKATTMTAAAVNNKNNNSWLLFNFGPHPSHSETKAKFKFSWILYIISQLVKL